MHQIQLMRFLDLTLLSCVALNKVLHRAVIRETLRLDNLLQSHSTVCRLSYLKLHLENGLNLRKEIPPSFNVLNRL